MPRKTVDENKAWTNLSLEELQEEICANHMWINAFTTIHPSDDLKRQIGDFVLQRLRESEVRDSLGISRYVILGFNAS